MQLAIRETMLPGRTTLARFQQAKALGFSGIEVHATGLHDRLYELAEAIDSTGVRIAAVHLGAHDGYLSPVLSEREAAIGILRQAIAHAVDLQTEHVVFVPAWRGSRRMPDLRPQRSPEELESEMLIWLLRMVSDLAYAFGVTLSMQPVNHYKTHFLTTVAQATHVCKEIKDHPHIGIAPDTFHMALSEPDVPASLRTTAAHLRLLYLSDSNGRLPGQGLLDFDGIRAALTDLSYTDWLILAAHHPACTPDTLHNDFKIAHTTLQNSGLID